MSKLNFKYNSKFDNKDSGKQDFNTFDSIDISDEVFIFVPAIGYQVSVFWPDENQYYDVFVHSAEKNGNLNFHYCEGDT